MLTLYRLERDAFSKDNLRILLAISSKVSLSIENALRFRQAEGSATTDYLTNLPNARSLFLRLEGELARCRSGSTACLPCWSAISTDSSRSTTATATWKETACCAKWPKPCAASAASTTTSPAWAGTNSCCCCPEAWTRWRTGSRRSGRLAWGVGSAEGFQEGVSLSVGAASYPSDGSDADQILAEADRRMYKAKQARKQMWASLAADLEQHNVEAASIQ